MKKQMNNLKIAAVSSSVGSKYDTGSTYESSTTRQNRYTSSSTRGEEQVTSSSTRSAAAAIGGGTTSSLTSTSASYFSIVGRDGIGKPVIKKTCKGVDIERKYQLHRKPNHLQQPKIVGKIY